MFWLNFAKVSIMKNQEKISSAFEHGRGVGNSVQTANDSSRLYLKYCVSAPSGTMTKGIDPEAFL